jgi:phytoene dehydrogenase-like protein
MNNYDAVIIGGGIGGLTCALLLAKKGVRVAVFEKERHPGGYCSSFSSDGYVFDACIAAIGGLRNNQPLRRMLVEELGIWDKLDMFELNPVHRNMFPDFEIDIPADVNQYKDALKRIFPAEHEGIDKSLSLMEEIYISSLQATSDMAEKDLLSKFIGKSFYDLMSLFISDPKLKAALSSYCTFMGLPAYEASAIAASNILMHYVKGGAFRVQGGIQNMIGVLVKEFISQGGKLFLGEKVTRILVKENSVVGIVTDNDRRVMATNIISGIDVRAAIKLMESCVVEEKMNKINKFDVSGSFVLVYLGVKDDLHSYNIRSSIGYFSSYDLNGALNKNNHISFGLSFPSLFDASVAPSYCGSIAIHYPLCYNENLNAINKDKIGEKLISQLGIVIPGISEKIVYQSIAGPGTLERYTGNSLGSAYGWKQGTDFLENLSLLRNLADNFYLVGHWAGYGGGVMPSMLSAAKVAKTIMGGVA